MNRTTESGASNEVTTVYADPEALEDTTQVMAPAPNPEWHAIALMQYEAAKLSAVRDFFEPTDWAQIFLLCEALSGYLKPQNVVIQNGPNAGDVVEVEQAMPAAALAALIKGFGALMFTEGERRRMRIEVERTNGQTILKKQATGDELAKRRESRLA